VAFGLFSKKQPAKPDKAPVKSQKAPGKKAEAPKAAVQPVVEEEGFSLDFTHYAEPDKPYTPPAAAAAAAPNAQVEHATMPKMPAGLDFASLVGDMPGVAPDGETPESPGDMGADFSQFLEKAEAIVEAQPEAPAPAAPPPVAKAPPPAPPKPAAPAPQPAAAKAPPAQPAAAPAPAPAAKAAAPTPTPAPAAKAAAPAPAPTPAPAAKAAAPAPAPTPTPAAKAAAPAPPPAPAPAPTLKAAAPAPAAKALAKAPPPAAAKEGSPKLDLPDLEYNPAPAPAPAAPAAPAKAAAPAAKAAPKPVDQEADTVKFAPVDLDFAPPGAEALAPTRITAAESKAAAKTAAAPAAKAALEAAKPAAKAKALGPKSILPKGGPKKPVRVGAQADISAPNSLLIAEVESSKNEVPGVIEEAAMAFANDQAQEALDKLDKAIAEGKLESWNLPAWLMRFDLYQELGRKSEFEEKALDFVVKFERSPPAWVEAPAGSMASRPGSSAAVTLSGPLSAASAGALDQLRKAAEKQSKLRVDFSKLESVDGPGCALLVDTLKHLSKAKKEVYISGESQIMDLLREKAEPCNTEVPQSVWLLLLELYQALGMSEEFEEAAVDYAVTYEVSPPSWEARPRAQSYTPPKPEASGVRVATDDSFRLHGEIAGQQDGLFRMLTDYVQKASPVLIDFAHTHRIDFVNAGRLAGIVEKAVQANKPVVLRAAGEMTIALFAVAGLHKLARIIPRK
jgi:anti-anti-sigma regulatory factor